MAEKKRIIMWTTPRTLSTAFCRAMMSRDKCKVIVEPSVKQFYFGPEAVKSRLKHGAEPHPNGTWKDLYNLYNGPFEGYKEVFVKEMPYRFVKFIEKENLDEVVPGGYIHTFLIRNPEKTVASMSVIAPKSTTELSWVEIEKLYDLLVKVKGLKPLVIDADDLQADPEKVLRQFCEVTGIDYQDTMVNWRPIPKEDLPQLTIYGNFFKTAMESNTFLPSTPKNVPSEELSEKSKALTDAAIPMYKKLKEASLNVSS